MQGSIHDYYYFFFYRGQDYLRNRLNLFLHIQFFFFFYHWSMFLLVSYDFIDDLLTYHEKKKNPSKTKDFFDNNLFLVTNIFLHVQHLSLLLSLHIQSFLFHKVSFPNFYSIKFRDLICFLPPNTSLTHSLTHEKLKTHAASFLT